MEQSENKSEHEDNVDKGTIAIEFDASQYFHELTKGVLKNGEKSN